MSSKSKSHINRLSLLGLSLALLMVVLTLLAGCSSTPTSPAVSSSPTPTASKPISPTSSTPPSATTSVSPTAPASPPPTPTRTSYNPKEVLLSSTTSVRDTGLMDKLIPMFQQQSGYTVTPVYVGSGAAIALGNSGNADVMVVHSPQDELKFVASGNGINRKLIMHNDFVLLGPASDPAKVKGTTTAVDAFKAVATAAPNNKQVTFYSRGDNSGTDAKDKALFKAAGVTVADKSTNNPSWYIEAPGGMGPLLLIADQNQGYALSDRGTYLAYQDKITLKILSEGDPAYLNLYHVIQVNPDKFPGIVNTVGAQAFSDFILGQDAQSVIANFKDKNGNNLFIADGGKTDADLGITQ
jgi:tungstate transport system substrate-binding protein